MKRISVKSIPYFEGVTLARTIYDHNGNMLLREGSRLRANYKKYLQTKDIHHIFISVPGLEDALCHEVISESNKQQAIDSIKQVVQSLKASERKNYSLVVETREKIMAIIDEIINEITANGELVVDVADLKTHDNYTFTHCLQVAILSILTAFEMGLNRTEIKILALGAILHDLGKIMVPELVLNKPGKLTTREFEMVKKHPVLGYEMFSGNSLFSPRAGSIIKQHHEKINGEGYPFGLQGDDIDPLAKIVAIADAYDAVTSERPYREAFPSHKAIEIIQDSYEHFDPCVVNNFMKFVTAYPFGTHVALNDSRSGYVVRNQYGATFSPVVRIFYEQSHKLPINQTYDIDLNDTANSHIEVSKVFSDDASIDDVNYFVV